VIDLVCWDFGDTLVDERWMRNDHPDHPDWAELYDEVLNEDAAWATAWEQGVATTDELIGKLAVRTGLSRQSVADHIVRSCQNLRFFPDVQQAVEDLRGRTSQACVTVNPDVFTYYVVPRYELNELFDAIVTSWETGLMEKPPMARIARRTLGLGEDLGTTLLVDNKTANVEAFVAAGGRAYHFRGNAHFAEDYRHGLAGLVAASRSM
jgi:FMN phosphatase YigB (HAD superfamily)